MSPLPCSPVSNSTASEQSTQPSEEDSDDSLTTPRPGPSDPAQRTHATLSQPSLPAQVLTPEIGRSLERHRDNPLERRLSAQRSKVSRQLRNPYASVNKALETPGDTSDDSVVGVPQLIERPKGITFMSRNPVSKGDGATPATASVTPASRSSLSESPRTRSRRRDDTESSADETTGMVRSTYKRTTTSSTYGTAVLVDAEPVAAGGERTVQEQEGTVRRKSSAVKAKQSRNATSGETNQQDEEGKENRSGWWTSFVDKYGSIELENKGSVARDHLALERTFLAWLRTSLSFASIGIAITQLFRLNTSIARKTDEASLFTVRPPSSRDTERLRSIGKPLGATFLGISILILLLGFHRFFESQHYVIRGKFPASRGSIVLVSLVAGILIIASLVVVVYVAPSAFET